MKKKMVEYNRLSVSEKLSIKVKKLSNALQMQNNCIDFAMAD
ncbi:hypothetical protein BSI_29170 [Bacillus inaquosorum KCTC 13429]|uniref:Uncharacterized protein n=2 Tax=Bacillus subtilis group TaxID=653685 RepID=A0A9W5LH05_9BACI|nr:hypothetical protein GYO_1011 [Bacillus spizizenii TU-B-10]ELS60517.1 hypothetical protein BSI_29170 [Bacillus inaquosorum KCTC 13429]SCV44042.1 hypothetical protein BQ1740_3865 [Bacillus subtilis]